MPPVDSRSGIRSGRRAPTTVRPDTMVEDRFDQHGRRVKRVWKRHPIDGRVEGFEQTDHEGRVHAGIRARTLVVTLSARQFGMSPDQLAQFLTTVPALRSDPRRSPSGLFV